METKDDHLLALGRMTVEYSKLEMGEVAHSTSVHFNPMVSSRCFLVIDYDGER